MKNKLQTFRFCCGCVRMTLLTEDGCYFCGSKFILATKTDDLNIREKKSEKTH
tara:strand:+ start:407 stop:565 length:159 start_codon:yes stop_codon:yes gene_type:complete